MSRVCVAHEISAVCTVITEILIWGLKLSFEKLLAALATAFYYSARILIFLCANSMKNKTKSISSLIKLTKKFIC